MRRILGTKRFLFTCLGLTAWIAVGAIAYVQQDPKKKPEQKPTEIPVVPLVELTSVPSSRISTGGTYDNQPAVAEASDGTTWTAWVRFRNHQADEVLVRSSRGGEPQALSAKPGQYIRPTLAAAGGDLWCLWTTSEPDRVSSIWYSRRRGDAWSPASRLLPDETARIRIRR